MRVIRSPVRAPNANAIAERWVATVRNECLDWTLVAGRGHLDKILAEYVAHYNAARPHRSLALDAPNGPIDRAGPPPRGRIVERRVLGGLDHQYEWTAA